MLRAYSQSPKVASLNPHTEKDKSEHTISQSPVVHDLRSPRIEFPGLFYISGSSHADKTPLGKKSK